MSFFWMIIVGLIAGAAATILMPGRGKGGIFVLGLSGSIIAGGMQYAESQPVSIVGSAIGAVALLAVYGITAVRETAERTEERDDFRKAA